MPSNVSLLHLPPASPELNPNEKIWQYMPQSYLSNRIFRDYDDVVEAASSAAERADAGKANGCVSVSNRVAGGALGRPLGFHASFHLIEQPIDAFWSARARPVVAIARMASTSSRDAPREAKLCGLRRAGRDT